MIQRFIELGEGYSDLYELIAIAQSNEKRVLRMMAIHTKISEKECTSLIVALTPTDPGKFQPLYICREGIPNPRITPNKRYDLFEETAKQLNKTITELEARSSHTFSEKELYYQYLIGILRLNHLIPPLQ